MDEAHRPSTTPETEAPGVGTDPDTFEQVYAFVRQVPPGKVVTYGQVAACLVNLTLTPREVGAAMRYAPADVPWQRVVGAGGHLPINKRSPEAARRQRELLLQEGVPFLEDSERIDLPRAQWQAAMTRDTPRNLFDE